jgi:hypothetical protein
MVRHQYLSKVIDVASLNACSMLLIFSMGFAVAMAIAFVTFYRLLHGLFITAVLFDN